MRRRYKRALNFIKPHDCVSERRETAFWWDNIAALTIPGGPHDLLDGGRFRPPESIVIDPNVDHVHEACAAFAGIGKQPDYAAKIFQAIARRLSSPAGAASAMTSREAAMVDKTAQAIP
jgi:tryptophan halogenase